MGTSMGWTTDEAAKMSTSIGLAGDLASFKNISIDIANNCNICNIYGRNRKFKKKLGIVKD
jgi:hypothetical protein